MAEVSEMKLKGYECIQKKVMPTGTGAHVYLPRSWMGKKVVVVRVT